MKNKLSLISLLLAVIMLLASCNINIKVDDVNGGDVNVNINTTPGDATESTTPEQTTPEVTTPPNDENPFEENQLSLTHVSVTCGNSPAEETAANDLRMYLDKKGVDVSTPGGFPITVFINESLDVDAFRVTAVVGKGEEDRLLIEGGNGRGILYGVYQFLEKYADVRFFTPELEVCEIGDVTFPDGVLIDYTPTFALRQTNWYNWISDSSKYAWSAKNPPILLEILSSKSIEEILMTK